MVDFEAGEGFSVSGNQVSVNVGELPDEAVLAMRAEAEAVAGERGLLEESAGAVTVGRSAELVTPDLLIATLDETGAIYTKVASELNDGRKKRDKVEIVPEDELADRANEWLNDENLQRGERLQRGIRDQLSYDEDHPIVVLALPNTPVSHEEIVQTWANARDGRLWNWGGRLAFLKQWPADALSGFDPKKADEPVRFVAIETGYDEDRAGSASHQAGILDSVQSQVPVRSATLFEGGVQANRHSDDPNPDWHDTYVRQVELEPHDGSVPVAEVGVGGRAYVDGSHVGSRRVSRRLAG